MLTASCCVRSSSGGHLAAGFGAFAAHLGALHHFLVASGHALAILDARLADLGAYGAGALVEVRPADHEVGAGGTDLGAVRQQALMVHRRVLTSHLDAVDGGFQAGLMAIDTVLYALLNVHDEAPHDVT
jgi:hypothetical protein